MSISPYDDLHTCCLMDRGERCYRAIGCAAFSTKHKLVVTKRGLPIELDNCAVHPYICPYHADLLGPRTGAKARGGGRMNVGSTSKSWTSSNVSSGKLLQIYDDISDDEATEVPSFKSFPYKLDAGTHRHTKQHHHHRDHGTKRVAPPRLDFSILSHKSLKRCRKFFKLDLHHLTSKIQLVELVTKQVKEMRVEEEDVKMKFIAKAAAHRRRLHLIGGWSPRYDS